MTHQGDSAHDHPVAGDPLLVRPYVRDDPAAPSAPTWPAPPVESAAEVTMPLPRVAGPPARGSRHRRWLALGALAAAVAVAAGIVGLGAALRTGDPREPQAFTDVSLPPWSRPGTSAPTPTTGGGHVPTGRTGGDPVGPGPAAEGTQAEAAATKKPSPSAPGPSAASPSPSTPSATPRLEPATAITGPGGLCLEADSADSAGNDGNGDSDGGNGWGDGDGWGDGGQLRVAACHAGPDQQWTVTTDGTLRGGEGCAVAARNGRVRIGACDQPRSADRWAPGPGGTLVNTATRACLTDRANGSRPGVTVRLEPCGAPGQQWHLP